MIGKIAKGSGFKGCVSYVLGKDQAKLLDCSGVLAESRESIIQSFATQRLLNPDIKKPVGHISLSYSVEDAPKLTDEKMLQLAHEYMKAMKITDTQYIIVRHHDREHPHIHIVFNRIDNNGKTISDQNDRYRNEQVCKQLKEKHGLYFGKGKENVKRERLKEPDSTKYQIYEVVKNGLKHSNNWKTLQDYLTKNDIQIRFKYKGQTDVVQGISFSKGQYSFKGSEVDRNFSYSKLDAQLNQNHHQQQEHLSVKPEVTPQKTPEISSGIGGAFNFPSPSNPANDDESMRINQLKKKKKRRLRL